MTDKATPKRGLTNIDDSSLRSLIGRTDERLFFMAPGVSDEVAESLVKAWRKLGKDDVTIILDVDPDVCRLGYGTIGGSTLLRQTATEVGDVLYHQPGVRIGVIVSDSRTLVFTPAPLLVEADSPTEHRPNAIELDNLPIAMAEEIGLGENPDLQRTVGLDPVTHDQIETVKANLAQAPPVRFDLARQVRVFTTYFQFVEFAMRGCYISRKKVSLPNYLVGLAGEKEIESRFHAQFDLIDRQSGASALATKTTVTEKSLKKKKDSIARNFLIPLKGFGTAVMRSNKTEFMERVDELQEDIRDFQKHMGANLQGQINKSVDQLASALLPAVKASPPAQYLKYTGPHPSDKQLGNALQADLKQAFGKARDHVSEMKVSVVFKDVAYESLADEEFLVIAKNAIPGIGEWYEEYDVVQAMEKKNNE